MDVFFYKAECGDAARISFVDNGKPHHILIDSGYERTYRNILGSEIQTIHANKERIDLWVISHIHDDHIGGAVNYINAINNNRANNIIDKWWYNPPRFNKTLSTASGVSKAVSIAQGDALTSFLQSTKHVPQSQIVNLQNPVSISGLKITVLSPSTEQLDRLYLKYKQSNVPLEKNEDFEYTKSVSCNLKDYHIKIEDFDLSDWQEDNNIENGSSISFLMEYIEKKYLWLADAHPSVVTAKLKQLGYSPENPLQCEFVKVAHHGSDGNCSDELLDLVCCAKYVFSVNGTNRHGLPNKKSVVRILRNRMRDLSRPIELYFTYDDASLKSMFNVDGKDVFSKWNFKMIYLQNKQYLKFS